MIRRRLYRINESRRVRRLYESFDPSMPQWMKSYLDNAPTKERSFISKTVDLYNSLIIDDIVPASNRDKRLKDLDRVNFSS